MLQPYLDEALDRTYQPDEIIAYQSLWAPMGESSISSAFVSLTLLKVVKEFNMLDEVKTFQTNQELRQAVGADKEDLDDDEAFYDFLVEEGYIVPHEELNKNVHKIVHILEGDQTQSMTLGH